MVLKNLNKVSLYIVPLLEENITWRDLTVECGFVNAYTSDKNRPYLEDKVFLLYDNLVNTKESLERYIKFKNLPTLYNIKTISIQHHDYTLYCFSVIKYRRAIDSLKTNGDLTCSVVTERVTEFWNSVDLNNMPYRPCYLLTHNKEPIFAELPEEDYYSIF